MAIMQELKIGDWVQYDANPEKHYGQVIGFRADGDIALLSSRMPVWVFKHGVSEETQPAEFIWRFNTNGKGIITYNPAWSIVAEKK